MDHMTHAEQSGRAMAERFCTEPVSHCMNWTAKVSVDHLTPAQQSEWATMKRLYAEAVFHSKESIAKAKAAYEAALRDAQSRQAAARELLYSWLSAHGVDRAKLIPLDPIEQLHTCP